MDKIETDNLIQFFNEKWKGRPCPMCLTGNWSIQNKLFELREYHSGKFVIGGGPIIPLIPITCLNCGNTILINAILTGIVKEKTNKKEEEK